MKIETKPVTKPEIVLTLSWEEAQTLKSYLGCIGGSEAIPPLKFVTQPVVGIKRCRELGVIIFNRLAEIGVTY